MVSKETQYYSSNMTFNLILKIGKIDLTPDLMEFSIISSLALPYQSFIVKLFLDPNDIITEKIYGQIPIDVTINLLGTEPFPMESIKFELMYLDSDVNLLEGKGNSDLGEKERIPITIHAVARDAYKTMNTFVNNIYQGSNLQSAILDLVKKAGATLKFDKMGQNIEVIDQILVPPTTLYKNLEYINRTFGLFNGIPAIYCSHDNVVHIKNLTNKMKQAQALTIYQFSTDTKDTIKIIEKCNDGIHYYTLQQLNTKYGGNSVFAFLAPTLVYVVKPNDRLEQKIQIDLEQFTKKYGLISKNDKIFFDKSAMKDTRKTVLKDHTGYNLSQTFINANRSKSISNITDLTLSVERSIKILNLMSVGESVEITAVKSTTTSEVTGRYILNTSEIKFNKLKDWEASAVLSLMRSNRTLT